MDDRYLKQNRPQSRRYRKRVLAVRSMAGETAWLDGTPFWREGRVVWESASGVVAPTRATLALAQRRMGQIAGSPRASRQAFSDPTGWLARRFARLEVAKRLSSLHEPDLALLSSRASLQSRDDRDVQRLAALLAAEVHCLNSLSPSPAAVLYSLGSRAIPPLLAVASDAGELPAARALAALALGALRRGGKYEGDALASFAPGWQTRSYMWGLGNGLPVDPALFVTILQEVGDAGLAEQLLALRQRASNHLPDTYALRGLLYRDVPPHTLVELCAACAEIDPIAERIGNYRHELPDRPTHFRAERAAELRQERNRTISELVALVHDYAINTADPSVVRDALSITTYLIYIRETYFTPLSEAAANVLRRGLELLTELQGQFLRLISERRDYIWEGIDTAEVTYLSLQLDGRLSSYVNAVAASLSKVRDLDLVRLALEAHDPYLLTAYDFKDPEIFRYALSLVDAFGVHYRYWSLMSALTRLNPATVREARQTIGPLAQAILQIESEDKEDLFRYFLDELPGRITEAREKAHRWALYIPLMRPLLDKPYMGYALSEVVFALDKTHGADGPDWFRTFLAALSRNLPASDDDNYAKLSAVTNSLRLTVPLGLALAGNDYQTFERIAFTALTHSFDHSHDQIDRAVGVLKRFPLLSSALARILPLQPHRCMDLVVKIGLASQLGKDALAPLGYLEGSALEEVALPEAWQAVVVAAPGVEEAARSYLLAHAARGESAPVPPGVRKALEQPQRIAGELAYIERKLAEDLNRADLSARADSLRARLANDGKLMGEVRVEIEERLGQAGAEAHIACAEAKTLECYRARLETLAGPLPADLQVNDNLVNATLLLGDIYSNRKLLLRLLRAYVRGNQRPHAAHPGNLSFLDRLADAGVDTQVWLSSNPRKFSCKGVAGGKVRLLLEQDPLGILQMGNYFDTCLSFGQINAFSTVANACELNKRVIYAYDGAGKVVGRKLIGINRDGNLIGFYTYSTLGEENGKALRAIFRRYCADFAQKCGLALAEEGTIPRLFAERWYDDGVVPWSDAEDDRAAQSRAQSGSKRGSDPALDAPVSAVP